VKSPFAQPEKTAKPLAKPARPTKGIFIISSRILDLSSLNDLLRDFSGSKDLRVARGQSECLTQGPLSDTRKERPGFSASMRDF
jgi:hypothetical protein